MKRGIIVFLEIALLVMFLQSSFAQYFLQDIQQKMANWMYEISSYADQHALSELRENMAPYTKDLSAQQRTYISELTQSVEKVEKFNSMYCVGDDKNPFVFGTTLTILCSQIQQSDLLGKS
jgi:hypothetical protein